MGQLERSWSVILTCCSVTMTHDKRTRVLPRVGAMAQAVCPRDGTSNVITGDSATSKILFERVMPVSCIFMHVAFVSAPSKSEKHTHET